MSHHIVESLCPEIPLPEAGALRPRSDVQMPYPDVRVPEVAVTAGIRRRCTIAPLSTAHWAAVAHDLRSHLNAILLSTETARLRTPSGRQIDLGLLLGRIERNARSALDLIDPSGMKRQAEPAERGLSVTAVELGALAHETIDSMLPFAEKAGIQVRLHAEADVSVLGDRIRLSRVISNLLANAIRHSPKDSSIDLVVSTGGSTAVCHVADRGPGVPIGERARIFERQVQGSGIPGEAGLGLFICREIVEEHGGRIWVEEHLPQGACFVFAIPLERGAPAIQPEKSGRSPVSSWFGQRVGAAS